MDKLRFLREGVVLLHECRYNQNHRRDECEVRKTSCGNRGLWITTHKINKHNGVNNPVTTLIRKLMAFEAPMRTPRFVVLWENIDVWKWSIYEPFRNRKLV